MKAAVYDKFGGPEVVMVKEWPEPQIKDNDVLIRVVASTVSSADMRLRSLKIPKGFGLLARPVFGFFSPRKKILGTEFSGVVVKIGRHVTNFKVGDEVIGYPGAGLGAHAELIAVKENSCIVKKPNELSFEVAAALPFSGVTAYHFLITKANIQPQQSVLVIGAAGAVGSAAVQIAKAFGAVVDGVSSHHNFSILKNMGCRHTYDYAKDQHLKIETKYDIIFESVGIYGYSEYRHLLNPGGKLIAATASLPQMLEGMRKAKKYGHTFLTGNASENKDELLAVIELAKKGKFIPIIQQRFALINIVSAHRYVDTGHKVGNAIIHTFK